MRKVKQVTQSDCFAASLASLLDLPLGLVPVRGVGDAEKQLVFYQRWLSRIGWTLLEVPMQGKRNKWLKMSISTPVIIGVDGEGEYGHAITGRVDAEGVHALHDPGRNDLGDYKIQSVLFLVPAIPPGTALENLRLLRE